MLGIVGAHDQVSFADDPLVVDAEFVTLAQAHGRPEERFRFASPCVENRCRNWQGDRCGVVDELSAGANDEGAMPRCAIRPECRWFGQAGAIACGACRGVITDTLVKPDP